MKPLSGRRGNEKMRDNVL